MLTDELDFLQKPIIQDRVRAINQANNDNEKKRFLKSLVNDIVRALSDVTVNNIPNDVSVNNLDEIKASLRNELGRANKPLLDILAKLRLSNEEQTKVMQDIENRSMDRFRGEFQPVYLKRPRDRVEISNLSDIPIAESVSITNLSDVEKFFKNLENGIKNALSVQVDVPEPKVTINIPETKIPQAQVHIPELDLNPVIRAIELNLNKIRTNDVGRPLVVRLSDGQKFINQLQTIVTEQKQAFAGFPGAIKVLDVNGTGIDFNLLSTSGNAIGDGSQDVTSAGTSVQLSSSSVTCKSVIITAKEANTGTIWVGGSTVEAGRGRPLVALQSEKIEINNLNKIYIDSSVNSEGVTYVYVS